MNPSRFASLACIVLAPGLAQCEMNFSSSPPATAQNAPPPPPEPAPATAPQPSDEAAGDDASYASGEYAVGADPDAYEDNDPSALTDFRAPLEPYGTWVDDAKYGTVWTPSPTVVGADFVPYSTAGHWAYDDDYVWVSDYEWGWAPFHYGRWVFVDGRGWVWIPGRVYRGAWVSWGVDDGWGYVGWYPMAPAFLWWGGVGSAYSFYVGPRWVYCPRGEVFSPVVGTRVVAGSAAAPIAARVRPFVPATPGVSAGPPPQKLGFAANQVPRPSGAGATSLARAQQFSRASTAQAVGGHPPTRVVLPSAATPSRSYTTSGPMAHPGVGTTQVLPGAAGRAPATGVVRRPGTAPAVAPVPRVAPVHGGGGHAGAAHGGGGHR